MKGRESVVLCLRGGTARLSNGRLLSDARGAPPFFLFIYFFYVLQSHLYIPVADCAWSGRSRQDVSTDRCVHVLSLMCPRTDVSIYSVRCVHGPMYPRTQPDVPTDRCVHVLCPMCPQTDVSTYSA